MHEAGHAVAWHANGGKVKRIEIRRVHRGWSGLCTYAMGSTLSSVQRRSLAVAAFAGPLACEVVGDPDIDVWTYDYEAAIEVLSPLYSNRRRLHTAAGECWKAAAALMSSAEGFGSVSALAARLVRQRTIVGFPSVCHTLAPRSATRGQGSRSAIAC